MQLQTSGAIEAETPHPAQAAKKKKKAEKKKKRKSRPQQGAVRGT